MHRCKDFFKNIPHTEGYQHASKQAEAGHHDTLLTPSNKTGNTLAIVQNDMAFTNIKMVTY